MVDRPDGFDFVSDGTILCFIDGEKRKLRRPKTGEFKALRLAVRERDDEVAKLRDDAAEATRGPEEPLSNEVLAEVASILATVKAQGPNALPSEVEGAILAEARSKNRQPTSEEATALVKAVGAITRELSDRQEELDRLWFADVFKTLADTPMPEDLDDWPVWLWQADNVGKFLNHWRNTPLARGPE